MSSITNFFNVYGADLLSAIGQHIYMTSFSLMWAILIGIPLGIICSYYKKLASIIMGIVNMLQAIPSLAILGLLIPILGIGSAPAIVMVTTYSLLPIVKNTYAGIKGIDHTILEASDGMGITRFQRLCYIEMPLARSVIISGIRIAAVSAIGSMTIAAYVGGGGLGDFIFEGIGMVNYPKILMGAIPAAILALSIDILIGKLETSSMKRKTGNKKNKLIIVVIIVSIALVFAQTYKNSLKKDVIIGSSNFPEQMILGNMISDLIEHDTDLKIDRQLGFAGGPFAFAALKSNNIDMMIDYSGSAYLTYFGNEMSEGDTATVVLEKIKKQAYDEYDIYCSDSIGFNNTYSFGVTEEIANKYNLKTFSDLAQVSNELRFVSTLAFMQRDDAWLGANKVYQFNFKEMFTAENTIRYQAIAGGQADALEVYTTDGLIDRYNIVVLEDDKEFFAPYDVFFMSNNYILKQYPELQDVMDKMVGAIDEESMIKMNARVSVDGVEPSVIAREFLEENNWFD